MRNSLSILMRIGQVIKWIDVLIMYHFLECMSIAMIQVSRCVSRYFHASSTLTVLLVSSVRFDHIFAAVARA